MQEASPGLDPEPGGAGAGAEAGAGAGRPDAEELGVCVSGRGEVVQTFPVSGAHRAREPFPWRPGH